MLFFFNTSPRPSPSVRILINLNVVCLLRPDEIKSLLPPGVCSGQYTSVQLYLVGKYAVTCNGSTPSKSRQQTKAYLKREKNRNDYFEWQQKNNFLRTQSNDHREFFSFDGYYTRIKYQETTRAKHQHAENTENNNKWTEVMHLHSRPIHSRT